MSGGPSTFGETIFSLLNLDTEGLKPIMLLEEVRVRACHDTREGQNPIKLTDHNMALEKFETNYSSELSRNPT